MLVREPELIPCPSSDLDRSSRCLACSIRCPTTATTPMIATTTKDANTILPKAPIISTSVAPSRIEPAKTQPPPRAAIPLLTTSAWKTTDSPRSRQRRPLTRLMREPSRIGWWQRTVSGTQTLGNPCNQTFPTSAAMGRLGSSAAVCEALCARSTRQAAQRSPGRRAPPALLRAGRCASRSSATRRELPRAPLEQRCVVAVCA